MNIISDFFKGSTILEEVESPVNGKIIVVKSLGLGTYFQVGKLTQSGGVVFDIWKSTLNKIKSIIKDPRDILILGIGGGSCARIARKHWPFAHITGVDFDQIIVDLGNKYLDLGGANADIIVNEAYNFVEKAVNTKELYNLVIVDLYIGQEFPVVFESDGFMENLKKIISDDGIVVFNRLYSGEKRPQVAKFGEKLVKYFSKVDFFYPEANAMLICRK